ncbi:MAG: PIN domain-containing protein [Calditrichaeota bacterium]|nr:MAG: PIN domain-containing protein [Calditrichota bacterium]MBL1204545.1 PIN domain-containing protein [Calditrichota bacterium]NOG44373.1 PIN domain-containing protein [Calditrichota bacterium]
MNTILIDTDILLDVGLGREPFVESSSTVLEYAENGQVKAFIAWHSIANFYYITEKGNPNKTNIGFIQDLLQFVKISPTKTQDALFAISLGLPDFEDALQVAAANAINASYILTRNIKHYKKSPIPAMTPAEFIQI